MLKISKIQSLNGDKREKIESNKNKEKETVENQSRKISELNKDNGKIDKDSSNVRNKKKRERRTS